ncbi:MAG: hypothetical protein VXW32_03345 [Myxococcota bacterium]|nr:hypothetical protein [Myxococcota bacterium]
MTTIRIAALSLSIFAGGCVQGSGGIELEVIEPETGLERPNPENETDTDTDTDTDTGSEDTDTAVAIDDEIVGTWKHRFDAGEESIRVRWLAEASGDCQVRFPDQQDQWPCTFSARSGDFSITDEPCGPGGATYSDPIGEDTLGFEFKHDSCRDRALGLSGEWTRVERE